MNSVAAEPEWPQASEAGRGRVNQPWRALVALVEVVVAAAAIWGAFLCWSNVVTTITTQTTSGIELTSTRYSAPWIAAAVGLGMVAGLLVVDAIRQLVLAIRARR